MKSAPPRASAAPPLTREISIEATRPDWVDDKPNVVISAKVPLEMRAWVYDQAAREELSPSEYIRKLIVKEICAQDPERQSGRRRRFSDRPCHPLVELLIRVAQVLREALSDQKIDSSDRGKIQRALIALENELWAEPRRAA